VFEEELFMAKSMLRTLGALAVSAGLASLMVPGCTIRIGPDSGPVDDSSGDEPGTPQEPPATTGTEAPDPVADEEAFVKGMEGADPREVAVITAKTSYALYLINGSIESQGLAPEVLDEATLASLVETYAPWALQEAEAWIATVDPGTLLSAPSGYTERPECAVEYGCPFLHKVWSKSKQRWALCGINDCGDGRCRPCPEWFGGFAKIAMKGWCSYVCLVGTETIGSAGTVIGAFRGLQISFSYVDGEWKTL
jgi:hypothetical protein